MSDRDDLLVIIKSNLDHLFGDLVDGPASEDEALADDILAAGFRRRTYEERLAAAHYHLDNMMGTRFEDEAFEALEAVTQETP